MKKLSLQERAARASERLRNRAKAWDNAHNGYLVGHRAAKRVASKQLKTLRRLIEDLKDANNTLRDINTYEGNRAARFESALRSRARGDMMETRHPYKELRP